MQAIESERASENRTKTATHETHRVQSDTITCESFSATDHTTSSADRGALTQSKAAAHLDPVVGRPADFAGHIINYKKKIVRQK